MPSSPSFESDVLEAVTVPKSDVAQKNKDVTKRTAAAMSEKNSDLTLYST